MGPTDASWACMPASHVGGTVKVYLVSNNIFGVMTMWLVRIITIIKFISSHWSLEDYLYGDGWPPYFKKERGVVIRRLEILF